MKKLSINLLNNFYSSQEATGELSDKPRSRREDTQNLKTERTQGRSFYLKPHVRNSQSRWISIDQTCKRSGQRFISLDRFSMRISKIRRIGPTDRTLATDCRLMLIKNRTSGRIPGISGRERRACQADRRMLAIRMAAAKGRD